MAKMALSGICGLSRGCIKPRTHRGLAGIGQPALFRAAMQKMSFRFIQAQLSAAAQRRDTRRRRNIVLFAQHSCNSIYIYIYILESARDPRVVADSRERFQEFKSFWRTARLVICTRLLARSLAESAGFAKCDEPVSGCAE